MANRDERVKQEGDGRASDRGARKIVATYTQLHDAITVEVQGWFFTYALDEREFSEFQAREIAGASLERLFQDLDQKA